MDDTPNVAILRDCYTRWHDTRGGSIDAWLAIADEQITLRSMADGRQGAEFTAACGCKDGLGRYLSGLTGDWDMEYFQVDEYIAQGDTVIALGSTAGPTRPPANALNPLNQMSGNSATARRFPSWNSTTASR